MHLDWRPVQGVSCLPPEDCWDRLQHPPATLTEKRLRKWMDGTMHLKDVVVKYHGRASHASAYPWEGLNALDAAVMAYSNLSVLWQQLRPDWRIRGTWPLSEPRWRPASELLPWQQAVRSRSCL
ncbi:hypothetical protein SRHO_G00073470 [Serrasalmus rhombeus]